MRITQTGLLINQPDKACPGVTLLSPLYQNRVFLLDLAGEIVHEWTLKGVAGNFTQLLDTGNLLVSEEHGDCPSPHGRGGCLREYDWDGSLVWEHVDPGQHHDVRRLADGNTIYLGYDRRTGDDVARIKGGIPNSEHEGEAVLFDTICEVTPSGEQVWEWSWSHEAVEDFPLKPSIRRDEFAHCNTVYPLPDGDLLVSFQYLSMIAVIDRETKRFKWTHEDWDWGRQHDVQLLPSGKILIFGNGLHAPRLCDSFIFEFDPETLENEIVYKSPRYMEFFSPHISGVERLPNGNLLVCEGIWGRIFEVTPQSEIVWEYLSPYDVKTEAYGSTNWVYRARRYAADSPQIQDRV